LWRSLLIAAGLAHQACAPALRPPRPLPTPPLPAALADPTSGPETLLLRAAQRFGARPDPAAVADAQALFLAAADADRASVDGLVGATRVTSWRIEHARDAAERAGLLAVELDAAQWCGRRAEALPAAEARARASAECDYRLAIALGQQAREHPSTAADALTRMVEALRRASSTLPELDAGGPDRILALVLLRAPGWPAGPGDIDQGLAAARRAVERAPAYPPNQLALAEGLAKSGALEDGHAAARAGRALAVAAAGPDAPEWIAEADRLLAR